MAVCAPMVSTLGPGNQWWKLEVDFMFIVAFPATLLPKLSEDQVAMVQTCNSMGLAINPVYFILFRGLAKGTAQSAHAGWCPHFAAKEGFVSPCALLAMSAVLTM